MLAALPRNIVISEASPLDWMIRAKIRRPDITDEAQIDWIRWMCSALGQKRWPEAQHYFIKLDAWHIFDLDLIERAYPDVPWIFLYRNPVEVMVSHKRQRGAVTFPGMMDHQLPGLSLTDAVLMPPDEYVARVLSSVCESALKHRDNRNGLFVNYNQLPQFVTSSLLQHFQVKYADDEIDCMNAASGFNAKNLSVEFTSDAKEKRSEASETIRQISDKMLMPLYEQLESVRYNSL